MLGTAPAICLNNVDWRRPDDVVIFFDAALEHARSYGPPPANYRGCYPKPCSCTIRTPAELFRPSRFRRRPENQGKKRPAPANSAHFPFSPVGAIAPRCAAPPDRHYPAPPGHPHTAPPPPFRFQPGLIEYDLLNRRQFAKYDWIEDNHGEMRRRQFGSSYCSLSPLLSLGCCTTDHHRAAIECGGVRPHSRVHRERIS